MEYSVQVVAPKGRGQKVFKPLGRARPRARKPGWVVELEALPTHRVLFIEGLDVGGGRAGVPVLGLAAGAGEPKGVNLGRAVVARAGTGTTLLLDAVPLDLKLYIVPGAA